MKWNSWGSGLGLAVVAAGLTWAVVAAAEDLDHPTILSKQLIGPSSAEGQVTPRLAFPAYNYTTQKDGLIKVVMTTKNVDPRANGGIAYRPYLRIYSQPSAERNGEAWSSNGYRDGATATAEVVLRVKKGEKFTIVTSLAQHVESATRVNVNYTVTVKE